MNTGRICISICSRTADELFEKIARAEPLADMIEVRLDCLAENEIGNALARIRDDRARYSKFLLATFRPSDQGGGRQISDAKRQTFWTGGHENSFWGGDFEEDLIDISLSHDWANRICSFHDFSGETADLNRIYEHLSRKGSSTLKIAVQSEDVADAIPVWKLLEQAKADGREMIPIAMSEAGKWTRILGLAHGAFMTYASLELGSETALGQITAEDMQEVFRVKELDCDTEVYGIIAGNTCYSISPWMHNAAFKAAGMNRVFVPLQTGDLPAFMRLMVSANTREVELNFRGFSVTNPHKQVIMEYLDNLDETAKVIGAVNTVKVDRGKLFGYNTDAPGFITPLRGALGSLKGARAVIVGAGGAARACIFSLQNDGAEVTLRVRDPQKAQSLQVEFGVDIQPIASGDAPIAADILVNATPLGTRGPHEGETVAVAERLKNIKLVYDLVYNPSETRLIREAAAAGCQTLGGLEMLLAQGAKQFEIWTGASAPVDAMSAAVRKKLGL